MKYDVNEGIKTVEFEKHTFKSSRKLSKDSNDSRLPAPKKDIVPETPNA